MEEINKNLLELKKLIENDGDNEKILEVADEIILSQPKNQEVKLVKMISLLKIGDLKNIENYDKEVNLLKDNKLLNTYFLYKKENYQKLNNVINDLDETNKKIIKSQILTQQENYFEATLLYLDLIESKEYETYEEELLTNFIYCLNMFLIINEDKINIFITNIKLVSFVSNLIEKLNSNIENLAIEIYLNLSILMVIIDRIKLGIDKIILKQDNCMNLAEKYLNFMMNKLREQDNTSNLLSDEITSTILKTILQEKRKLVNWTEEDVSKLENYFETLKFNEKNILNRVSILLYLCFIKFLQSNPNLQNILKKLENEMNLLKNSLNNNINTNLKNTLIEVINYNAAIILLNQKKYKEAQKIISNNKVESIYDNLVTFYLKIKTKNYKDLENKYVNKNNNEYELVENFLLKLSCYQSVNDQKKYIETFKEFMNKFFIKQLNYDENKRFLNREAFSQFTSSIASHIFMNYNLISNLKEYLISFIDYFDDYELLKKIAENFILNKDNKIAEEFYKKLSQKYPEIEEIKYRLNYLYSLYNPLLIDENTLPIVDIITDTDKLKFIENNYLSYKVKNDEIKNEEITVKKIKKKRKRKIKWPKNFDFKNPGRRPDEERWIPKYERKKYLKRALKKGLISKNQGTTLNVEGITKETFKTGPSTSNMNVNNKKKNFRKGR